MSKKVCVVGAGVAGLAAVKHCLDENMVPTCYEKDTDIGGLWNYHDVPKDGDPSLYNSCSINTSKEMTCYSDFPIPKEFPNFMAHKHFKRYLQMYADQFSLMKSIKFKHNVESIQKADDFEKTGRWVVIARNIETGKSEKQIFDFVMLCHGHLHEPNKPKFPGLDKFKGRVLHTHDYKDFKGFEGKTILIIGIGNSASDVACELSRHAEHVYISTRRGTYVVQRAAHEGRPFDHYALTRMSQSLPWDLMRPLHFNRVNSRYKHSNYGLSPNYRFDGSAVTISDDLPNRILLGTINMKGNVKRFTERGAVFEDGTEISKLDIVILGTGFNFSFPFLQEGVITVEDNFPSLYELVWPADLQPSTLAVIGLVQPFGALPPVLEMQARWASRVFSGHSPLPSPTKRLESVNGKRKFFKSRNVSSPKSTLQIFFVQYIDKLAGFIGCKPRLWKYFFQSPSFWLKLYFGPCTPPQWRLDGPGQWKGAKDSIQYVEYNTWYPMKTREAGKGEGIGLYEGWARLVKKIFVYLLLLLLFRQVFFKGYLTYLFKS